MNVTKFWKDNFLTGTHKFTWTFEYNLDTQLFKVTNIQRMTLDIMKVMRHRLNEQILEVEKSLEPLTNEE
jgi:hypothetical protein